MKNLFILFFDELGTDSSENIDSFSGGLCMSSPRSSWFTVDKQGILTLFFYVVKPLYEQFFDWNRCVDIGSERKTWKSVQNSFFDWRKEDKMKMKKNEDCFD